MRPASGSSSKGKPARKGVKAGLVKTGGRGPSDGDPVGPYMDKRFIPRAWLSLKDQPRTRLVVCYAESGDLKNHVANCKGRHIAFTASRIVFRYGSPVEISRLGQ